jgi:ribosomal protein L17
MVEIKSRVRESVPFRESDVSKELDRMQMVEALRHGNIYEVFAKSTKFKLGDFTEFFGNQWKSFKGQVIQDSEIKAGEAAYPQPDLNQFSVHHKGVTITPDEGGLFMQEMMASLSGGGAGGTAMSGKWKSQTAKSQEAGAESSDLTAGGTGTTSGEVQGAAGGQLDVQQMGQDSLGEWQQFLDDSWGQIFDSQMMADMNQKMSEVKQEVQRLVTLAKEGKIGAEFVLIALAKVNATKNGCLITWLGKKAFHLNESLSKIANDLHTMSPADPRYYGMMEVSREKTRDGSFQMQLVTQDMQKVMSDMASTLEFVKGSMDEINRTKREIITAASAR